MFRLTIFLGLIICAFAQKVSVIQIENAEQFRLEHPDAVRLETIEARELVKHYIGIRSTGDKIVGEVSGGEQYSSPSNVRIEVNFGPTKGERLNYIIVKVLESSTKGRAHILYGGLGQTFALLAIEAYETTYIDYVVEFYGK